MAELEALVGALEEQNARAVELAEAVSIAVRVEPFLLRRMRLEILPDVDSGAEADVWLSPLVQVRSPEGVVFHPEIADWLRTRLRDRDPVRFGRAWSLLRECHAHLPPAVQLEEEIAWRSADPGAAALEAIDHLLKRAAKTLVSAEGRQGITNWAARALPRLPARVRNLEGARMLASASYLRLARHLPAADVDSTGHMPDWMAWILPANLEKPDTYVRVRLVSGGVELSLGETGGDAIPVPDMRPCLVEISWQEEGREEVRQVAVERGERRVVRAPARDFLIRTVLGERYQLAEKRKMPDQPNARQVAATCFVVMGFGRKTDYATGRVLDLDRTYRNVIKPAAEAAGMRCLRADEIVHGGVINLPMYEWLLKADVVVADLSTSNADAFYELGVRHTMRPYGTIVIAEQQMAFPFSLDTVAVRRYRHMGEDIGIEEARRFQTELQNAIQIIAASTIPDSPVYTFLRGLLPPSMSGSAPPANAPASQQEDGKAAVRTIIEQADQATSRSDFVAARTLLAQARSLLPNEVTLVQKLAMATYRSRLPTPLEALQEARKMLLDLHPETTTDTETLGLWAAIHKRIWEIANDRDALELAVDASEKGFLLKNDYYNGINYAFLLNVRARVSPPADAVADFVLAQRVRRKVIAICETLLTRGASEEEQYWILASLTEAWLGLGDREKSAEALNRASKARSDPWMHQSTAEQLKRLEELVADSPLDRVGLSRPPAF